ncbi:MAG: arsenite methyltransferase [Bacteroidetes bacterium]|nr:arsenite methyltransferase [Bacteroidota bacterium]
MSDSNELKNIVKQKYGEIAVKSNENCCGPTSCCGSSDISDYSVFNDDYTNINGYVADADLNLGCGLPTEYAGIKTGDTVFDLGSGAGNDVFIARQLVGETGKVIGLDFTEEMLTKAKSNNEKLGYKNVEFKLGDIEVMPIEDNSIDVVISNCVLNLVPDKQKAFSEIYRTLKPGAHFCVSDVVVKGNLNDELKKSAELYAGCVSGAISEEEYIGKIEEQGFKNVQIKKRKKIDIPENVLKEFLNEDEFKSYKNNVEGIFSITVTADK